MEISIIEFINQRKQEIDRFAQDWMIKAKDDPENWPLFLTRAEWDEQELITIIGEDN